MLLVRCSVHLATSTYPYSKPLCLTICAPITPLSSALSCCLLLFLALLQVTHHVESTRSTKIPPCSLHEPASALFTLFSPSHGTNRRARLLSCHLYSACLPFLCCFCFCFEVGYAERMDVVHVGRYHVAVDRSTVPWYRGSLCFMAFPSPLPFPVGDCSMWLAFVIVSSGSFEGNTGQELRERTERVG